jgi:hypothetical protein
MISLIAVFRMRRLIWRGRARMVDSGMTGLAALRLSAGAPQRQLGFLPGKA